MPNPPADRHPLDTDLLDLVDGAIAPSEEVALLQHLEGCVLCRIKTQRLTNQPPITFSELHDLDLPSFETVAAVPSPPSSARPGDLWLTSDDEAVMVLVRKVLDTNLGLVVVPVTLDIEVADNGTLILEREATPLPVPLAIYDGMLSSIPFEALQSRIETNSNINLLSLTEGDPGVTRGAPLEGPGDPRHEVRQYIADRLTRLSPLDDNETPPTTDHATNGTPFARLNEDLDNLRGGGLNVDEHLPLTGCPDTWEGLGQVRRRHLTIGIIGTPAGLTSDRDFVAARGLVLRTNLSALVVCPADGTTVDLYTPESLYDGYEVPSGTPGRRPFVDTHGLADSIHKFLDARESWNVPFASETGQVERIDVPDLLDEAAQAAVNALANTNFRGPKREGWQRAASRGEALAALLRTAADGTFDPAQVADLVDADD